MENKKLVKQNEMREFVIGIILLAVGLFMLSMRVRVQSGWFAGFTIGSFDESVFKKYLSNNVR